MPLVDRRSNSIVLRIAYDGPPSAGKATNLGYLCERLALTRPGTPDRASASDRTQFLDWLDVTGGWPGGERVRCQLVVMPGQIVLARRRRHFLESADAVVFVADARPGAAPETSAALRSLARGLAGRADVPIVLQANKQDLPGAQGPWQLHDALGLAARVPAIAASAAIGDGVLESFLQAVRLAVDHVRALLVAGELGDETGGARELRRALDAGAPEAFDALDAVARAADAAIGRAAAPPPVLTVVTEPDAIDEIGESSDNTASDAPTRPIRVIRCAPVRTTTTAEARAMIDAAMQATLPVLNGARTPAPLRSVAIASLARASNRSIAPEPAPVETGEPSAANREAATRPLRLNRFTPAKAILTGPPGGAAASTAPTGPIPIPIVAPPPAVPAPATVPLPIFAAFDGTLADPPVAVSPTSAATLVAVVAVEAHAIAAVTIEPIAIDAITIERDAVEPPAPSAAPVAPVAPAPEPFVGTDDDPTWELPAVDPAPPVAAASLESSILDAIARQDEPTAPIELVPPDVAELPTADSPVAAPLAAEPPAADPPPAPRIEAAAENCGVTHDTPAAPQPFQLPPVDLPAGMVWPGVSGRAALAAIAAPARIVERPAPWAPAHAIELACSEGWSAHTSAELVFPELERGKLALFEAVRWQAKLEALTPPGRTYALSPERDRVRLWVLTPAYRTVWAAIEEAFARGDRAAAGRLARIGLAAVDELRARGVAIADLDHIAVDDASRLLATPWTEHSDRLILQLQRLFASAVL